jgi:curved DNA-binding protein CbpA
VKAVFDIRKRTLAERARLVQRTDGTSDFALRRAYRELARRHHPDLEGGDTRRFQLVREAYVLLTEGQIPEHSLLADDDLVSAMIRLPDVPMPGEAGREAYFAWHRDQFFGDW